MPSFYPKSCEPIQRVLDDPDFTFPLLHDCGYFMQCNALKLLERHPKIEKLSVFKVNIGEPSFKAPLGLLPNLRHFCGHISDYFKLCTEYAPPLECLDIDMLFNPEEERTLVSELANTKTLRQLSLTGYALSLLLFAWITRACPKLTHFKCTLGREKSLDFIFQTVLHDLPDLEHLKLHYRVQASLHPLKTLEIDILLTSAKRIYFYFMKDNNRIISVPELDANRFDWFNFV
ncbi:hypothetical protein BT96DRAFT_38729 [Gymnopus androsaceus JB14]|uniref:F-box domain-containing protein n=1 Tax=Gymnopus androsaceus JB14 TaxID=1447944 RepID=A0A6A4HN58_9AGAR|nr:hypothetical protein BT96DRAFT_38729 [Gymnopus androsaceus JB14]